MTRWLKRAERKFVSDIGKETALQITTSVDPPDFGFPNFDNSALDEFLKNNPMQFIGPGITVGVNNLREGQIFINKNSVIFGEDWKISGFLCL